MSPNSKDRLMNTVIGGVFIPAAYGISIAVLDSFFKWHESLPMKWLYAPLIWPVFLFDLLIPARACDADLGCAFSFVGVLLLLVPVANFAFYSLLTYAVIRWRQRTPRLR